MRGILVRGCQQLTNGNLRVLDPPNELPSSPWLSSGARCSSWGAGSRSSRQGQAGRVREDLQPVRCGILLHPRHGHVH